MQHGFKLVPVTIRDVSLHLVASKLELPICCLLPVMYAISRCDPISSFFTYWKDSNIPNIKKQNRRTDKYDRLRWFPSLSVVRLLLLHEENKPGSSVTELRYRMFTEKNLSRDRLPSTLDALVLHLCRALIFFHQYLFKIFFLNSSSPKISLYIKQFFPYDKKITKFFSFKLSFITHHWHWM